MTVMLFHYSMKNIENHLEWNPSAAHTLIPSQKFRDDKSTRIR